MSHYYFHLNNKNGSVRDLEGGDYADLDDARNEAIESAREIMAERIYIGQEADGSVFEIVDEAGRTVLTVPFETAMTPK